MRPATITTLHTITFAVALAACSSLTLDPPPAVIHARFDPDARVIPMPTDVLRDAAAARLDLPNDTAAERAALTPAAAELFTFLETLDGWSTLASATLEMTGPLDPASVSSGTVQCGTGRAPVSPTASRTCASTCPPTA